jgi:hypothetical protein
MARFRPFNQVSTPFWHDSLPEDYQEHGEWKIEMLGLNKESALRAKCGIPEDYACYRITVQNPLNERGYSVSIFGHQVKLSTPDTAPRFDVLGQPAPLKLLAAQRCVRNIKTPLWLEALWHPETGITIHMHGLEYQHRSEELTLIRHGLIILRKLDMGRTRERSRYYTEEEFKLKYPLAYLEAQRRRPPRPRKEDVARAMNISLETFNRYLADYHCPFPPNV